MAIKKAKCCAAVIQTAWGSAEKGIVGKDHWGKAVGEEIDNKFFCAVRQDGVYVFMQLRNIEVVTGDNVFGFIDFIDFAIFVIDIYRLPRFDKKFSKRDLKDLAKAIQIFVAGETSSVAPLI